MPISDPISLTARWTAAARARESHRPDRLFDDPYAAQLAGEEGFDILNRMASTVQPLPGTSNSENVYVAIRTRYFDDVIMHTLANSSIRQVVFVAAGLDTRAYRLNLPGDTRVFELDREEVLEFKESVLAEAGVRAACRREVIPVDLTAPFGDALIARGFDPTSDSLWIMEGLLPYLNEDQAATVLTRCAELASTGSILVCDLVGESFLQSSFLQPLFQALAAINAPWIFATDDPESFFARFGWNASVRRPGENEASYGRWPFPLPPRRTPGMPESFFVTATRV